MRALFFVGLLVPLNGLKIYNTLPLSSRRTAISRIAIGTAGLASLVVPQQASAADALEATTTIVGGGVPIKGSMGSSPNSGLAKSDDAYINMEYTGWLDGFDGANKIDASSKVSKTGFVRYHVGVGSTTGEASRQSTVPIPLGFDEPLFGATVGSTIRVKIPAAFAFGNGGKTGMGVEVPKGAMVYYEIRARSLAGGPLVPGV